MMPYDIDEDFDWVAFIIPWCIIGIIIMMF